MPLGVADQTEGSAVVRARFGAGGLVEKDFGGDVLARQDWSSQGDGRAAAAFAADANGRGLTAVAVYYELRVIGRRGRPDRQADAIRAALGNATLMRAYWRNAEELVRQFGSAGGRATLVVEPSVLSILQAAGVRDPRRVRVVVSSAGVRELRGLSPSLVGFAQAWTRLRDRLAPRLRLALPFDDYATGDSIAPTNPPPPAVDARAVDAGAFYRRLGARYDLAAYETAVGDAGHGHGAATWEPSDYVSVTRYLRGLVRAARLRVLLIGVPVGNTVTRSMDNTPYHWRDNHVQWMLGAGNRLAHLRSLRDAGVIGAVFGFGNAPADETCACDAARDGITNPPPVDGSEHVTTSADDDGGYLGERVVALRRAGGIALR